MSDPNYTRGAGFQPLIDEYRCTARHPELNRRCQLYADHGDAHASAQVVQRKPWRSTTWRWDDTGQWVEAAVKPLRWCCMHAD